MLILLTHIGLSSEIKPQTTLSFSSQTWLFLSAFVMWEESDTEIYAVCLTSSISYWTTKHTKHNKHQIKLTVSKPLNSINITLTPLKKVDSTAGELTRIQTDNLETSPLNWSIYWGGPMRKVETGGRWMDLGLRCLGQVEKLWSHWVDRWRRARLPKWCTGPGDVAVGDWGKWRCMRQTWWL